MEPALRQRLAVIGRRGGLLTASRVGPRLLAERARRGFLTKFELQVDPEGLLDPEERSARAKLALRAHMAALAARRWAQCDESSGLPLP